MPVVIARDCTACGNSGCVGPVNGGEPGETHCLECGAVRLDDPAEPWVARPDPPEGYRVSQVRGDFAGAVGVVLPAALREHIKRGGDYYVWHPPAGSEAPVVWERLSINRGDCVAAAWQHQRLLST